jgi:hypothetical protein
MQACSQCAVIDDAARRMCAEINLTVFAVPHDQLVHSCMAFRLDDGSTDHTLYPSRETALTYQLRPACVFHFRSALAGVSLRDMAIWLGMLREAYANDRIAWVDPASPDLITSTRAYDHMRRVRGHG